MSGIPDDITEAYGEVFDAKREVYGFSNSLEFIRHNPSTGPEVVDLVSEGWFPQGINEFGQRVINGPQFFEVSIAQRGDDLINAFSTHLTHLKFEGMYYKIDGAIIPPVGGIKVWKVRVLPTGQRKP